MEVEANFCTPTAIEKRIDQVQELSLKVAKWVDGATAMLLRHEREIYPGYKGTESEFRAVEKIQQIAPDGKSLKIKLIMKKIALINEFGSFL